jgi:hypothetical protein
VFRLIGAVLCGTRSGDEIGYAPASAQTARALNRCMCSEWTIRLGDAASDTSSIRCGYDGLDYARIVIKFRSNVSVCARTRCDARAIIAAASIAWNDGHVEGQVHRPKIVKRQMYCCGSFNSYAAVLSLLSL